jgi:ribosome-binding protein aMBF1 (putative translation factor)
MKQTKRKKLEAKGWKVGSTSDFLQLTPEEQAFIEMKLALSDRLKTLRQNKGMSQIELAKTIKSSQSRVAKMEAADESVSIDLLIKTLLTLGATQKELGRVISQKAKAA